MERKYILPEGWESPPGYTEAVLTTGRPLLVVSGQVPINPAGEIVGRGDFTAQVKQCFDNLAAVLAAGGCSFADVVKLTYFVVGMNKERLTAVRQVRDTFLPAERRPASSAFGVTALFDDDAWIEIEALAELPAGAK